MKLQLALALATTFLIVSNVDAQDDPKSLEFFEKKIRPVLVRECYSCHSSQTGQSRGGLMLDTQGYTHLGGDSGPAIEPGSLEDSLLWNAINYEDYRMPPNEKLPQSVINDFKKWIEAGAFDPRVETIEREPGEITPADIEKGREFWAFRKPSQPATPSPGGNAKSNWAVSEIDLFIEAKRNERGLQPAADADPATLLRRLHFDLTGLPPMPADIAQFESEYRQNPEQAIARKVDALLESPAYGERWARHWLDVARYAESTGRELNATYPNAWRYRDYVIDSFNNDKPYDRFIREQIAGDLLPAPTDAEWQQNLIATGFLAIGPKVLTERNGRQFNHDLVDEQIDVTTRVVLGVSVACARCHDHKFDPIPQSDYYAMAGIFQNTVTHYGTVSNFQNRRASDQIRLPIKDEVPAVTGLTKSQIDDIKEQIAEKRSQMVELARARRSARNGRSEVSQNDVRAFLRTRNEIGSLQSLLDQYDENGNPETLCIGVQAKRGRPTNAKFLVRGEFDKPTDEIPRGFVQVISKNPPEIKRNSTGRLELARWLTEENPLTARVMVNRIWQHLMGQGIVRTPANFGSTGLPPTHPELLDYLALQFEKSDWSVKSMIRQICTSRTYRMDSAFDKSAFSVDPENESLWRYEPRRLDAEALRDSVLAISGDLNSTRPRASIVAAAGEGIVRDGRIVSSRARTDSSSMMGGDSNSSRRNSRQRFRNQGRTIRNPYARDSNRNQNSMNSRRFGNFNLVDVEQNSDRRSIYLPILRDNLVRSLDAFDFAEPSLVVGKRETSNTPDQALYFLNNTFVIEQSQKMARRIAAEIDEPKKQIDQAFRLAYGREPSRLESQAAYRFYREFKGKSRGRRATADERLAAVCQSILASAEFRYLN